MSGSSSIAGSSTGRNQVAGLPQVERQVTREGSVTLQYPMLSKDNYASWAIKVQVFMDAQGVWDVVDSAVAAAADPRRDKMALTAIYQCIPEDTLLAIAEKKTARHVWDTLKTMHLGADRVKNARVQTLRTEFEVLRMRDAESLMRYRLSHQGLWQRTEELLVKRKRI
ncbi:hypothetical protein QQ045_023494 [Rhodiola kirilowii]